MPLPEVRAYRPPDSPRSRRKLLGLVAIASVAGSVAVAAVAVRFAVQNPQTTDFAGVTATHQAELAGLGCIYSRSVQIAGAQLVPGILAPISAAGLPWHFNEPPVMTLLAAPVAGLQLPVAVAVWELVLWGALAVCAVLLWRERNGVRPWLMSAVVAALLLNDLANTGLSLAQNDALLLVAALFALDLMRRHHDVASGVLLGLVAVKPQLLFVAVVALIIHHRWRIVAACAATATAIGAIGVLMVGPSCSLRWLGSATQLGEFQIGIGLPGTLGRWSGNAAITEIGFLTLSLIAVFVLIRIRSSVDTPRLVAIGFAFAVAIGLHILAYDVLFLVPLGIAVATSKPWHILGAGWVFTIAWLVSPMSAAPILASEVAVFAAVTLGTLYLVRASAPSGVDPNLITTMSRLPPPRAYS